MRPGRRPLDGSPPTVTLAFGTETAARQALHLLGGGVRGAFRVVPPQWLSVLESSRGGMGRAAAQSDDVPQGLPQGLPPPPPGA